MLNNYTFTREGEDKDNEGLMIPRYLASGRTAPNGKVYPEVARTNEDDLVPVRSIVKKRTGDINMVTPDLLSKRFLQASSQIIQHLDYLPETMLLRINNPNQFSVLN